MSETETFRGKLSPIDRKGLTLDQWIQNRLGEDKLNTQRYETWLEALSDDHYKEYVYKRETDTLYAIIELETLNPYGFTVSESNPDGTYDFVVSYYNGGASFDEVMDSVLDY